MSELKKTYLFVGAAIVLLIIALLSSPGRITPNAFLDQGEPFYPEFVDANEATSLEVIGFDETSGSATPFKITFKDGLWRIPSHNDYPADGKERLAQTAAGVIDIKKDEFRSDNISEHEKFGVIDPLSQTTGLTGRGQRVTIRGSNEKTLADFIVGKEVEGRQNFRYVRLPDQNRVYAVRMDVDISTNFEDWIDRDLMRLTKEKIKKVEIKDYSINERTYKMESRDNIVLSNRDDKWSINRSDGSQQLDTTVVDSLLETVTKLQIVGVHPKPEGISSSLASGDMQLSRNDMAAMQNIGFYFTRDGQLLSNEGELIVHSDDGLIYTLHFGEVVFGSALSDNKGEADKTSSSRYLFITSDFDEKYFNLSAKPTNESYLKKDESEWTDDDRRNKERKDSYDKTVSKIESGRNLSSELNRRFADWYYLIDSEGFGKIHLKRSDLVVNK